MKISEIITDKYKLRIEPTVYYDLLADVREAEEKQEPCEDATLKDIFCIGCEYKEQKPICPNAGVDCEDCPAYEPKTDWIVSIILTDEKGEEHDGLMDMRRMLIYLHNIPTETAISLGYTWKSAEGSDKE